MSDISPPFVCLLCVIFLCRCCYDCMKNDDDSDDDDSDDDSDVVINVTNGVCSDDDSHVVTYGVYSGSE